MFDFWKNEWQLFMEDLRFVADTIKGVFVPKDSYLMLQSSVEEEEKIEEPVVYEPDAIDHKVSAYFGENVEDLRNNISGDKTQHEVLRDYAQFFKPYNEAAEMCNSAFRKYYDRHALKIATSEFPLEQARIIQNNVDLFIKGQEVFGENGQFIDSRVDTLFDKAGLSEINKVVNILHDGDDKDYNLKGERIFAEIVSHMVDNGIKYDKKASLLDPVKMVLEDKLNDVHSALRTHEDWNDEYQNLLSQERKYLYALNRVEQYETEQKIAEYEQKVSDLEIV